MTVFKGAAAFVLLVVGLAFAAVVLTAPEVWICTIPVAGEPPESPRVVEIRSDEYGSGLIDQFMDNCFSMGGSIELKEAWGNE